MARTATVLVGLGLLTLSACSGDADPSPPRATPTATTSTPSPSPSPTPPAMPDAAKAHTKAGAKAFVEYFWEVVDYAQQSGNTASIRELVLQGCKGCEGGIKGIDDVYERGGSIRGGRTTPSDFQVEWLKAGKLQLAYVTVNLRFSRQSIDLPGTENDKTSKGSEARDRVELLADDGGWKVAQLVVLR